MMFLKKILTFDFLFLLFSQFLSKIGDYAHEVLFVLLVIEFSKENYFFVGLTYFVRFIPYFIVGPIGGVIADIYNKKKIMLCSDFFRFILTLFLAMSYINGTLTLFLLMIFSFLFTFFRIFFQPAYQSAIPLILDNKNLLKANSSTQISSESASIIGPLLCSIFIGFNGKSTILIIDSATYLISMLVIFFINIPYENKINKESLNLKYIYKTAINKITSLPSETDLFNVIAYSGVCILFTGSLLRFILPAHILIVANGNEVFVGYIMATIAFGTIVGAILFANIKQNIKAKDILKYWAIYGIIFFLISLTTHIYLIFILALMLGSIGAFVDIAIVSHIQTKSKPNEIGKNFSIFSTIANTGESASGLISGLVSLTSINISFVFMSIMLFFTPSFGLFNRYKANKYYKTNS